MRVHSLDGELAAAYSAWAAASALHLAGRQWAAQEQVAVLVQLLGERCWTAGSRVERAVC